MELQLRIFCLLSSPRDVIFDIFSFEKTDKRYSQFSSLILDMQ